ncbi:MAG: MATE family efflux transporter [Sphaerochaetaceae bacterium]|nr:MATE family efflux transporter [Sphaerochaetaceae bacterium]
MEEDRKIYYKRLKEIALPISMQNLLASSLSFVDTLMIGQLGVTQIAGVGLGNQIYFLISLLFFGISSGSAIFISQYWGAENKDGIQKALGISLLVSLIASSVFAILSIFTPRFLIGLFTDNLPVIKIGSDYLRIVGISYIFSAVSFITSTTMRSTGNTKTPLYISLISLSFNAVFNYLLIFGIWIFPKWGVAGAALSTSVARLLEMLLLLISAHRKNSPAKIVFKKAVLGLKKDFRKVFFKTSLPVILNECFWSLGMTVYKVVYAHMGIDVLASINISESIQNLFFVFLMSIGNAVAIIIGITIGKKKYQQAQTYAIWSLQTAIIAGIIFGGLMALFSPIFPRIFNVPENINKMTTLSLLFVSLLTPLKSANMTIIVGILRSGGDTKFSLFTEMSGVWLVGVPIAFIAGIILQLPIYYVLLLTGFEELFKFLVGIPRILKQKWMNDLTEIQV